MEKLYDIGYYFVILSILIVLFSLNLSFMAIIGNIYMIIYTIIKLIKSLVILKNNLRKEEC